MLRKSCKMQLSALQKALAEDDSADAVWVCCDACDLWCHGQCAGVLTLQEAEALEEYRCPACVQVGRARARCVVTRR